MPCSLLPALLIQSAEDVLPPLIHGLHRRWEIRRKGVMNVLPTTDAWSPKVQWYGPMQPSIHPIYPSTNCPIGRSIMYYTGAQWHRDEVWNGMEWKNSAVAPIIAKMKSRKTIIWLAVHQMQGSRGKDAFLKTISIIGPRCKYYTG